MYPLVRSKKRGHYDLVSLFVLVRIVSELKVEKKTVVSPIVLRIKNLPGPFESYLEYE